MRPAPGSRTLLASVIALGIAVGGLAYFAFHLWGEGRAAHAALATTETELAKMRAQEGKRRLDVTTAERRASDKEAQLSELNAKVLELSGELAAAQSRLEELDAERAEIADRLAEFRRMTEQFRMMIDTGKLEIAFRRGRMIVQLPAQVLFPSGSAELTEAGIEAIGEVAKILRGMRDQHFIVGGHTDTVPVSNDQFSSNWGLSAARAVNVTEALVKAGLKPGQLVAAGYGEFDPVAKNTSQAGRQKNRRIEIILEPKLREIPDLASLEREAAR
jgi:chemotaxis protein MotB